jgi:hypothetical protein
MMRFPIAFGSCGCRLKTFSEKSGEFTDERFYPLKMTAEAITVHIFPLVPNVELPRPSQARTRPQIPPGYGVQEQCLPFTAASALGLLIPSPIRFGLCDASEVPQGCHPFRSPLDRPAASGGYKDSRVYYVADNPNCRFVKNAFTFEDIPTDGSKASSVREPGLSFFDREDQQDLFKLSLPYIWRTPPNIDTLFLRPLNRSTQGLDVLSGLVETEWYAAPVNLVLRKPQGSLHVREGDAMAQVVLVPRDLRSSALKVVPEHARLSRNIRKELAEWYRQHVEDRGAYKVLARSRHGRIEP